MEESEVCLRRALKVKPNYVEARSSLGLTLTSSADCVMRERASRRC